MQAYSSMSLIDVLRLMLKNKTKILAGMVIFGSLAIVKASMIQPGYISTIYIRTNDSSVDFPSLKQVAARATDDVLRSDATCRKLKALCLFDMQPDPLLGQVAVNVRVPNAALARSLVSQIPSAVTRENELLGVSLHARRYRFLRDGMKRTQQDIDRIQSQLKPPVSIEEAGKQRPDLFVREQLKAELMFIGQVQGENPVLLFDLFEKLNHKLSPVSALEDGHVQLGQLIMLSRLESLFSQSASALENSVRDDLSSTTSEAIPDQSLTRKKILLVFSGIAFGAIVTILYALAAEVWGRKKNAAGA